MSESATGCVVRGLLVDGSSGEGGRCLQRCAQRPGTHLSCFGSWRTSRPQASVRHEGMFLLSCCVLPLHRREAPLRSVGSPASAHGPAPTQAPHAGNNRNAGKSSAFMCSHIPTRKIGRQAPVSLRYSTRECRYCIAILGQRNSPAALAELG